MLSDPFPNQFQQMVAGAIQAPPQGGNHIASHKGDTTSKEPHVYMVTLEDVNIQTKTKNYENREKESKRKERDVLEMNPFNIEKSPLEIILIHPKVKLKRVTHNPNSRATKNYSIVKHIT